MYVVGPRLIDGRVGVVFFGVGGSRSARTLHYIVVSWGGCFSCLGGFGGVGFGEGGSGGANNVLGWPSYKIFSWTCCYAIHSSLALYLKYCRYTKRKMAITKWAKVCNQWSSDGCGVKQFCRVLPKNWCHTLSVWWRNIMTFNNGFIHWNPMGSAVVW